MKFLTIFLIIFLLVCCNKSTDAVFKQKPADDKSNGIQYSKEVDELKKALKSEVKIKLKKDAKGLYNWEIAGKDVHEILKTNEIMRKKLD